MRPSREFAFEDKETGAGGFLVIDATDAELSFGGTRIDTCITREMVAELAENMSLKLAGHGSPVGGAKAGLRISPDDPRLKDFLGRFADACREALTSTTILGKDMGAKQWMLDEIYKSLDMPQLGIARKRRQPNRCPERLFELDGYIENMTGKGVYWSIAQAFGDELRGVSVLIQGFGVVGSGVAWHLDRAGARIVGISDRDKAVVARDGFDVAALIAAKDENGLVDTGKLPDSCTVIDREELLAESADVLILAAGSYVVDSDCAVSIQTPVVVEAANLALLPAARSVLHAKSVRVVPDVVANSASAALVGHQIASGNTRSPEELWADIEGNIRHCADEVERVSRELDIDSKRAFRRVLEEESVVR